MGEEIAISMVLNINADLVYVYGDNEFKLSKVLCSFCRDKELVKLEWKNIKYMSDTLSQETLTEEVYFCTGVERENESFDGFIRKMREMRRKVLFWGNRAPVRNLRKLIDLVDYTINIESFKDYDKQSVIKWVRDEARIKGVGISYDGARELFYRIGNDLWLIDSELEKLKFLGEEIDLKTVRTLVGFSEAAMRNIVDLVLVRDKTLIDKIMSAVELGIQAEVILNSISYLFMELTMLWEASIKYETDSDIIAASRIDRRKAKFYLWAFKKWSYKSLYTAIDLLCNADILVKVYGIRSSEVLLWVLLHLHRLY